MFRNFKQYLIDMPLARGSVARAAGRRRRPNSRPCEPLETRLLLAAANPFPLTSLNGSNGFRLDAPSGESVGEEISSAGDINGDGFDDIIVGAWDAGFARDGAAYVVFGQSGAFPTSFDLLTLDGSNGFRVDGIDGGDYLGRAVSSAGDVNGDGYSDLLIGASGVADIIDGRERSNAGEAYVVFGKPDAFPAVFSPNSLDGTNGFTLDGLNKSEHFGAAVETAGDFNGDGYDDLIVGAPFAESGNRHGDAYIIFGQATGFPATLHMSTLNGTNGLRLPGSSFSQFSGFGESVSAAGDVNGDGIDDVIIGAGAADNIVANTNDDQGNAYVIFGSTSTFTAVFDLTTLDGTNGFRVEGVDIGDTSGEVVSGAGDVNGDGFDDLIIGAKRAEPGENTGTSEGESYVVFGTDSGFPASLRLADLNGTNGFRINGIDPGDDSGVAVSAAGDVNADGIDDFTVGASHAEGPGVDTLRFTGESYIVFGRSSGFGAEFNLSDLDGNNGFRVEGLGAGDQLGIDVSQAGDVNGDGFDDVLLGGFANGSSSSNAYIIFGGNFTGGAETQVGSTGVDVLTADQGASVSDILIGGLGGDTLISDGGEDILIAGHGNDIISIFGDDFASGFGGRWRVRGGRGVDRLRISRRAAAGVINLSSVANNRITGIEAIDVVDTGHSLLFDVPKVLNLSDTSNVLTVYRSGNEAVNSGGGWTQQANEIAGARTFEVFTQGAATLRTHTASTVSVSVSPNVATEDSGTDLVYTFTRDVTLGALTVDFSVSGSARFGSDYTQSGAASFSLTAGSVVFADGQATATVTVTPTADNIVELDDWVQLTLQDNAERLYLVGASDSANGTITDDDSATFTVNNVTASEEAGAISFTVFTSNPVDKAVTVQLAFSDVTAVGGTDYNAAIRTVVFPANDDTGRIVTVPVTNDNIVELNETFTVAISTNTPLGARSVDVSDNATGTITDSDVATFAIDDVTIDEDAGTATLTVSVDNPIDIPVDIDVSYADGTAVGSAGGVGGDYDNETAQVTFAAGTTASQQVAVSITDDNFVNGERSFTAALSLATDVLSRGTDLVDTATVTIQDDEAAGFVVAESDNDTIVTEAGSTDEFTVVLSARPQSNVELTVAVDDQTEATVSPARLTFTPANWDSAQTVTLTGLDDATVDGDVDSAVTIAVDTDASDDFFDALANQQVTVTTTDDDIATLTIEDTSVTEGEGLLFTVRLDSDVQDAFEVNIVFTDGSATGTADYDNTATPLTFNGNKDETQQFTVSTTDDSIVESTESFTISLTATNALVIATDQAVGTIVDNDPPVLPGNIDGDNDFDANDSFLLHLVKLAGTDSQIDQSKGSSPLTAAELRANIGGLNTEADIDGDGQFDANDSFLIHLLQLAGTNAQIDQSKGNSSLTAAQIRTNFEQLGSGNGGSSRSAKRTVIGQPPVETANLFAEPEPNASEPPLSNEDRSEDVPNATPFTEDFRAWIDLI